ncbi:Kunitz/Bovine pancreatic trypsin inhibitor domain protein [Trichuris suis]|nr:Kunitz/Bovine pancreatic trypsin inhibitor domain protein [Trichuris suis]
MELEFLYAILFFLPVVTHEAVYTGPSAVAVDHSEAKDPSVCQLQPDIGPCRAARHQWYYNITLRECALFVYGGCEGNGNRFEKKKECRKLCVKKEKKDPCKQPMDPGPCEAASDRWYYNEATDDCEMFTYGGCQGNENNFATEEQCRAKCVKAQKPPSTSSGVCMHPSDSGPCRARHTRWFFDLEDRKCKKFIYGGCQGNSNNFESKQECEEKCLEELKSFGICGQPADTGNCRAKYQKWFFNPRTRKCETFTYGGCGGNSNNFESKQQCETVCLDELTCNQKMDVGPCRGAFPMWYYNRDSEKCEPFDYGGCKGNANRFNTKAACDKKCNKRGF